MNQSLLDEFADECRRAVQRLVDEYGFSRERAKRLVLAELASARAPSPSEVFKAMRDYAVDWDRGYELMSVAAAARDSPSATTRAWIQRLRNLNPSISSSASSGTNATAAAAAADDLNTTAAAAARRSMSFSLYSPGGGGGGGAAAAAVAKKRTLSEASMEMEEDIAVKRPAQKLNKKE